MSDRASHDLPRPMVEGEHLMAYVSRILQAAGGEEEDPVVGLITEAAHIARGDDFDRVFLAEVVKWAARAYAERLHARAL